MKGKLNVYYDEDGDFLELQVGEYQEGYMKNLGKGIFERIDKKTGKVTGLAIWGFRKRTEGKREARIYLPLKIELSR